MALPSCSALSSRTDFAGYIALLRNVTQGDFSLVKDCRTEICGALWGPGNSDISGIGMAVGYILESIIAALLIIASLWNNRRQKRHSYLADLLLSNASRTFYYNAVFFTFAIQMASIITLSRANFGVSADGMGAITMKIAWLVSTLTLMPLLTMVVRPQLFSEMDIAQGSADHENAFKTDKCHCERRSEPYGRLAKVNGFCYLFCVGRCRSILSFLGWLVPLVSWVRTDSVVFTDSYRPESDWRDIGCSYLHCRLEHNTKRLLRARRGHLSKERNRHDGIRHHRLAAHYNCSDL